jgi:spermidine synthase
MIKFFEIAPFVPITYTYDIEKIHYKGKSKFQEIMVIENPVLGKMLILDGIVQLTEKDEFFYHEMLTHVVLHAHPLPRNVVVIGGGDGGTVREVLKHRTVEKVFFVEIDEEVINISKKFFPTVASGIDDSRVEIKCMDGAEFIKQHKEAFDAVIVDSTDPIGFAKSLFTPEFFQSIKNCLKDEGFFVTHTESLLLHHDIVAESQRALKQVFPVVDLYAAPVATYPGNWWAYAVGSKKLNPREMKRKHEIDTKFYDDEVHTQFFVPRKIYSRLVEGKLNW